MSITPVDRIFLREAQASTAESHDPDRRVGVAIVNAKGELVARDTNRPPSALSLSISQSHAAIAADADWKYFVIEHAERNAIRTANARGHCLIGATMYGTLFPCADCARAIVDAGISRLVVLPPEYPSRDEKWLTHYGYSSEIFKRAGVNVEVATQSDLSTPTDNFRQISSHPVRRSMQK